ncbi:MAG TPA: hypothetical protein VH988_15270 [Thermoanaerobaculia bacterium]|jgi:hypothetical protein|nr:hypothetical protein [Thermoanaerobaculia bacterium]
MAGFVQSLPYRDIAWGLTAFRPAPPGETLRSLSADCKGKVLLLQALLSEAGIESTPVLCHSGPGYQNEPAVPSLLAFDHAVLAVHLPGAATWPGALADGPGQGWLLFDPTNPLATFGLPPPNLENGYGLWLGSPGGGLFPIHTRQPGCHRVDAALAVELTGSGEARWKLTTSGDSPMSLSLTALYLNQGDAERFRQHLQESFRPSVPGAVLASVHFDPPDHRVHQPARLEIGGTIPHSLQPVGGGLSTLFCLRGDISLTLPAGWTVAARPALHPVASPWLAARTADEPGWNVTVEIPRGRFAAGSEKQRRADLNALAALFRQPFLLKAPGT